MAVSEQFTQALTAVLQQHIAGFQSLLGCQQLSAGANQETYRITYHGEQGETRLALRRSPNDAAASSWGSLSLETEAKLFQMALNNGIPCPNVHYVLQPQDALGSGFLMEWLDGETLGHRIVKSDALATLREGLAYECGEILGRIHAIDWQAEKLDTLLPQHSIELLIDNTWQRYSNLGLAEPMIDYAWRWLKAHMPTNARQCLVHADFRNGNIMVTPDGINAVLDWELAHIGDPVQDLGWICTNSWRFGRRHLRVGGFGELDDLLAGYKASSGIDVSPEEVLFWEVFGSFSWACGTLAMTNSWRTGETPSLERPVIGRRSSEAQMDCVNLLIPGEFSLPAKVTSHASDDQIPMPAELIDGAVEFLKQTAPQLDTHSGFLARVAANSLQIAQREFLYGRHKEPGEQQRLTALLGVEADVVSLRRQLVQQLRDGMALETPGLAEHLRQTVAEQLAIDQPKYSALQRS